MTPLPEAQSRLLALVPDAQSRAEMVPLANAHGRYLLEDCVARRTQPAASLSAMDGYAMGSPGPWRVVGESAAGAAFVGTCAAGEAVRIFTGAVLPAGCDRVVMQEDAIRNGDGLTAPGVESGHHVRPKGSDFSAGKTLVKKGDLLTPARLALIAAGGYGHVRVARPVRVALISTGSELVAPGETTRDDQIPGSNDLMLAAQLSGPGVIIDNLGSVPDDPAALDSAINRARTADIIITIGGASVGDHDLVRPALIAAGAEMDFWKVAIKPGKPLMAGRLGDALIIGLPGNPVSAFITSMLFAQPGIAAMLGARDPLPTCETAILAAPLPANGNRTDHIRAVRTKQGVSPIGINDSAALSALAMADLVIVRPPNTPALEAGSLVPTLTFNQLGTK